MLLVLITTSFLISYVRFDCNVRLPNLPSLCSSSPRPPPLMDTRRHRSTCAGLDALMDRGVLPAGCVLLSAWLAYTSCTCRSTGCIWWILETSLHVGGLDTLTFGVHHLYMLELPLCATINWNLTVLVQMIKFNRRHCKRHQHLNRSSEDEDEHEVTTIICTGTVLLQLVVAHSQVLWSCTQDSSMYL